MSFYLQETPTLEAVATEDERVLAQDLEARVAEAVQQAESHAPVCEAAAAQQAAQDRLERLRAAERALNRHAKESRERVTELSEKALENLVDAAASGKKAGVQEAGRGRGGRSADPDAGASHRETCRAPDSAGADREPAGGSAYARGAGAGAGADRAGAGGESAGAAARGGQRGDGAARRHVQGSCRCAAGSGRRPEAAGGAGIGECRPN